MIAKESPAAVPAPMVRARAPRRPKAFTPAGPRQAHGLVLTRHEIRLILAYRSSNAWARELLSGLAVRYAQLFPAEPARSFLYIVRE